MGDYRRCSEESRWARAILVLGAVVAAGALSGQAWAGNEANFVLYDHHTDAKGEVEVNAFSDFSNAVSDDPRYNAQLLEIEGAITDRWEAALYLEGDKTDGEDYQFGGWRLESRYRLFDYGAFLNPVLYVEYENLNPDHKYLLEVTGRTDAPEGPGTTEHEIESKLIVGHDITNKLDVAFNWINETNLDTGRWEFGYALGFNYAIYGEANARGRGAPWKGIGTFRDTVELGPQGGQGRWRALWRSWRQRAWPNTRSRCHPAVRGTQSEDGIRQRASVMVGGAAGLTRESERGLLRLMLGYEFE